MTTTTWCPVTPLEDAARAYVAARLRNQNAEPRDWTAMAAEVDRTWYALLVASGLQVEELYRMTSTSDAPAHNAGRQP